MFWWADFPLYAHRKLTEPFRSRYGGQYTTHTATCAVHANSHSHLADACLRLSKYAAVTKGEKDLFSRFKSALGLSHEPTEDEKSQALKENAEAEEAEHQARMEKIKSAEKDQGSEEGRVRVRREILYGRQR